MVFLRDIIGQLEGKEGEREKGTKALEYKYLGLTTWYDKIWTHKPNVESVFFCHVNILKRNVSKWFQKCWSNEAEEIDLCKIKGSVLDSSQSMILGVSRSVSFYIILTNVDYSYIIYSTAESSL